MKAVVIYGNPKRGGFVHGCLDFIASFLEAKGVEVEKIMLVDSDIRDCAGCFTCLRTGRCTVDDDMGGILETLKGADGIVAGASVRNGFFTALYKRFYERITYLLGFTRALEDKPVLAIGAVGIAGGRKNLGRLLSFKEFQTLPTGYLFFRTGIPGKLTVDGAAEALRGAAAKLIERMENPSGPSLFQSLCRKADTAVIRAFMLKKNPDGVYDYVVKVWREKGLLK